jgi:hypothetical protein
MNVTIATGNSIRLVHRPGPKTTNGTFVGWGPKLGSI